jgi:hypothetical protein
MENKFWVLEYGRDCDGCETRGTVYGFSNHEEAEQCLERCVEWSDGMQYQLTGSIDDLKEYCYEHQLTITDVQ